MLCCMGCRLLRLRKEMPKRLMIRLRDVTTLSVATLPKLKSHPMPKTSFHKSLFLKPANESLLNKSSSILSCQVSPFLVKSHADVLKRSQTTSLSGTSITKLVKRVLIIERKNLHRKKSHLTNPHHHKNPENR
jgi:hypothetical protein